MWCIAVDECSLYYVMLTRQQCCWAKVILWLTDKPHLLLFCFSVLFHMYGALKQTQNKKFCFVLELFCIVLLKKMPIVFYGISATYAIAWSFTVCWWNDSVFLCAICSGEESVIWRPWVEPRWHDEHQFCSKHITAGLWLSAQFT